MEDWNVGKDLEYSVRNSVCIPVGHTVWNLELDSVYSPVRASVWSMVGASVWNSVKQ